MLIDAGMFSNFPGGIVMEPALSALGSEYQMAFAEFKFWTRREIALALAGESQQTRESTNP